MQNDIQKNLNDSVTIKDKINRPHDGRMRGHVWFKDLYTGKPIFEYEVDNKVIIAGSQTVAQKCFGLDEVVALPTYNTKLGLDNIQPHGENDPEKFVYLFCCGTQGCGSVASAVQDVKYTKWIQPSNDIVPFRCLTPEDSSDTDPTFRSKYFGRKNAISDIGKISYYFKGFETDPELKLKYVDGRDIEATVYDNADNTEAETYVEMTLRITEEDFREWFNTIHLPDEARINSISLCYAWPYTGDDGFTYYQDITPFTQLNIPNESLIDLTKGILITYHVYF